MPNWYKDLFAKNDSPIALTVRTRVAPLLLRLAWDGHPLVWSDKFGWTFKVSWDTAAKYRDQSMTTCDMQEEENTLLRNDTEHVYFKLPHKDGPSARCTSPLAKGYQQFFENGTLSSEFAYAKEALDMNASCSYWISARDRITSQMVVYDNERVDVQKADSELGYILPQVIPMGTITRRAVENTWLTASNAKKNRVGSELKSMITAPPSYSFVGADVDSQELWIASLTGDASFKLHGGNAIGFMDARGDQSSRHRLAFTHREDPGHFAKRRQSLQLRPHLRRWTKVRSESTSSLQPHHQRRRSHTHRNQPLHSRQKASANAAKPSPTDLSGAVARRA